MSGFAPPNGMPKDINNRLGGVKGLNPEDPNDTAYKLVTILCILLCQKNSPFFPYFLWTAQPPPPMFSLSTGDEVDDNGNSTMNDDIDDDGNGAMGDDDNGEGAMGDEVENAINNGWLL